MTAIRIHATREDWPHLSNVRGIEEYWNRALMFSGTTVAHCSDENTLDMIHQDYRRAGVGANKVIRTPKLGGGFYKDILNHPPSLTEILNGVRNGQKIDIFTSSNAAMNFIKKAGLDWQKHTCNPTIELAAYWNNKANLRQAAAHHGMANLFPRFRIVKSIDQLYKAVDYFGSNGADGVVVKMPNLASTEGMVFLRKKEDPKKFVEKYWDRECGAIVEEAYEHIPFSVVFDITDEGCAFMHGSLQMLSEIPVGEFVTMYDLKNRDASHRGNVVGSTGINLANLHWGHIKLASERVAPLMEVVRDSGYRGKICADLLLAKYIPVTYVLELNARTSHSMYAAAIHEKAAPSFGGNAVVVAANVKVDKGVNSYELAKKRLANRLYTGGSPGVLMYHVQLIPQKAGLIAIAGNYDEALRTFREAEAELNKE